MENQEIKNILKSRRDGIQNVKKVDEDAVFEGTEQKRISKKKAVTKKKTISQPIASEPAPAPVQETKDEQQKIDINLVKGITVGIDDKGSVYFSNFGNPNYMEMAGFSQFLKLKIDEILNVVGNTIVYKTFTKLNKES